MKRDGVRTPRNLLRGVRANQLRLSFMRRSFPLLAAGSFNHAIRKPAHANARDCGMKNVARPGKLGLRWRHEPCR